MSRRDTLLIAVLINVGLLVILFATAVTSPKEGEVPMVAAPPEPVEELPMVAVPKPIERYVIRDEIDEILATPEPTPKPTAEPVVQVAPPPPPKTPEYVEVTVKQGDVLDKIARGNQTTVEAIMEANNLKSTVLQIGQKLKVPLAKKKTTTRRRISSDTASADDYYTIRSGDSPWLIARRYSIPVDELLALNDLDENAARKLKPGDRIRIR